MKKLILSAALMLISLQAKLYAQNDDQLTYSKLLNRSKTELTYNVWDGLINIRDFVVLKEGRLILDLHRTEDYANFRNLDSILVNVRNDIAFYKDSLSTNPTGSVKIDYVLNEEYSFKKIRFTRHEPDGNSFLNRDGEISKLKFDQDTVRIIIQKSRPGISKGGNGPCTVPYSIQATFVLGYYYDIDKVVADNVLKRIIDTLEKASPAAPGKSGYSTRQMSITYNPYFNGPGAFHRYKFLMKNEYSRVDNEPKTRFSFNPQVGGGLTRNTLVPVLDIAVQYNDYWNNFRQKNIFRLSATGYYFFDKDISGNFLINDNWFANGIFGNISDRPLPGWYGTEATFGVGYLISQKGGYFRNNTFRVFTDIMFIKGVSLVPELIFTNDFKQIFPGITLKVLQ